MPIRVEGKDNYKWTHGHPPRGYGAWYFKIAGETKTFTGSFTDAQKAALKYARKHHPKVLAIRLLT